MRREIGWFGAILWGGSIAFVIALVSIGLGRYRGWRQSINPNFNSRIGGGEYVSEVDGILTAYGWLILGQRTLVFVALGALVALVVRWIIGKPQPDLLETDPLH